jgi:hypothetical protein
MTSVVVAGALAAKPQNGGEAWVRLSYVLGLRRLGLAVSLLEQVSRLTAERRRWFETITEAFGVRGAIVDDRGRPLLGAVEPADLLLNISGNIRSAPVFTRFRRRAYVDLDPGFTQAWHAQGALALDGHHVHFTVGENLGTSKCTIPTNGIRWRPTRPPVVLDEWPAEPGRMFDRFTTVATWRPGHGPVEIAGRSYGLRVHSFRRFVRLPRTTALPFEAALAIGRAEVRDLALLREAGWRLTDPRRVASDPASFRSYVVGSGAEFTAAQEVYTATASGWLSDRTARYLASARPALVEDTGNREVPSGQGLVTFRSLGEAERGARSIAADYETHCRAAHALAVAYFDSDVVLGRLLEEAL